METYLADKVSLSSGELVEIGMSDLESHPIETLRKIYREIDLSRGPTEVICDCGTARGEADLHQAGAQLVAYLEGGAKAGRWGARRAWSAGRLIA